MATANGVSGNGGVIHVNALMLHLLSTAPGNEHLLLPYTGSQVSLFYNRALAVLYSIGKRIARNREVARYSFTFIISGFL